MIFADPRTGDPIVTPCMTTDGSLWFSTEPGDQRTAKRICNTCPAVTECLKLALDHEATHGMGYRHGVWGSRTPSERSRLTDRRVA